ncbi:hypothetical protein [uncultured Campylobacter sp.]|uniref:hypothetical protein n=1 Tax=uncultured Campylobacter sp. TaxID=218934 RepID=UPI0025D64B25|nr:hypothetical protein [uncultured Campylobacter sp.]
MLPWLIGGVILSKIVFDAINSDDDDSYEQSSSARDRIEKEKEKQRQKIRNELEQYKKDVEKEMLDKYGATLNYSQQYKNTSTSFWLGGIAALNHLQDIDCDYKITANSTKLYNLKQSIEQSELKTSDLKRLKNCLNEYINTERK